MTRLLRIGIAALAAAALVLPVVDCLPAAAVGSPGLIVALPPRGDLSTTGKAVRMRVKVTCSHMSPVPIDVHLTQTRSQVKVTGDGTSGTSYTCNGHTQRVPVIVFAKTGSRFNTGGATATATAECGSSTCPTDTRNVQLAHP